MYFGLSYSARDRDRWNKYLPMINAFGWLARSALTSRGLLAILLNRDRMRERKRKNEREKQREGKRERETERQIERETEREAEKVRELGGGEMWNEKENMMSPMIENCIQ